MSIQSKTTSLQAYNLLLFRNALHPEFFGIEGRQRIEHGEYEFEGWIFSDLSRQDLQGDGAIQRLLPCAVHRPHAAGSQQIQHLELGEITRKLVERWRRESRLLGSVGG